MEIGVHTGRMNTDVQNLRTGLARASRTVEALRARMDALNNMWEGSANAAMRQRFQADYASMRSLCSFLESMIDTLESARRSYDRCESDVSQVVSALSVQ